MNGDLKLTFIRKCLEDYMASVKSGMALMFQRYKVGVTDEGLKSIASDATESTAHLRFKEYIRFVDMGVGRRHPLGGLKTMAITLRAHKNGVAQVKDNVRKPKKIYAKTAYGKLTWLENKLMHGYTEETIAMLKQTLEDGRITA